MDNLIENLKERPKSLDIMKIPNIKKELNNKEKKLMNELKSKTHSKFFTEKKKNVPLVKSVENLDRPKSAIYSSSLQISDKTILYELRNSFQKSLAKLNNRDTKEIGYKELVSMISKFNNNQSLRLYIGLISISHKNCSLAAKELQVMLIGVIAQVYQENLQDPLDSPPSNIKTIERLLRVIQGFMKENSEIIHYACGESIIQLYQHCMPKHDILQVVRVFIDSFVSIIESGVNVNSQKAACLILNQMVNYLKNEGGLIALNQITPALLKLSVKTSLDSPYLYEMILNLMNSVKFENFTINLKELYDKIINVLDDSKSLDLSKVNCCKILNCLSDIIKAEILNNNFLLGFYVSDIIESLKNATKDRVHKVQIAAREALKSWLGLEKLNKDIESKKMKIVIDKDDNDDVNDLKNKVLKNMNYMKTEDNQNQKHENVLNLNNRNKLELLRNLSKINKEIFPKISKNLNTSKTSNFKEDLFKQGISNMLRISGSQEKNKNNDYFESHLKYGKNITTKKKLLPSECIKESLKNIIENDSNLNHEIKNVFEPNNSKMIIPKTKLKSINNKNNDSKIDKMNNYNEKLNKMSNEYLTDKLDVSIDSLDKDIDVNDEDKSMTKLSAKNKVVFDHENYEQNNMQPEMDINSKSKSKSKSKLNEKRFISKISNKSNDNKLEEESMNMNINMNIKSKVDKKTSQLISISKSEINNFKSNIKSTVDNMMSNAFKNQNYLNNKMDLLEKRLDSINKTTNKIREYLKKNTKNDKNNKNSQINQINKENQKKQNTSKDYDDIIEELENKLYEKEKEIKLLSKQNNYQQYSSDYSLAFEKEKENIQEKSSLTDEWTKIIVLAESKNYNLAFSEVLKCGDDLYLIRLLYLVGDSISNLDRKIFSSVMLRLNMVVRSHQTQNLIIKMIGSSIKNNTFYDLDRKQQNNLLETLFEISNLESKVGQNAGKLYTEILNLNKDA